MRPLSVAVLLTVWERELDARPFERALGILSFALPNASRETLARITIGRRDALLLQLREWAFGADLGVLLSCPRCGQELEMPLKVTDLRASTAPPDNPERLLELREYTIQCRAPNSEDLMGCSGTDVASTRRHLLARCVTKASYRGQPIEAVALPDDVVEHTAEAIASLDPQADTRIELSCPDCHHCWSQAFDIVSFFWAEIDAWARRTLREVHILAAAYGWSESDVLALSPRRRHIYVAMALA
jgi:hypothetical protein